MDGFLDYLGLYRSDIAKDGSCLFRAVSEQLFYTQIHHTKIRLRCVEFMQRNREKFENDVNEDFDSYLEKLKDPKEWAGLLEVKALSLKYKIQFVIYLEAGKHPLKIEESGDCSSTVALACAGENCYDSVYTKPYLSASAICQSLSYEIIYKKAFKLGADVDMAVAKMLHDKAYSKQRKSNLLCQAFKQSCKIDDFNESLRLPESEQESGLEIQKALAQGIPPFPYKVAKTLDPNIYRNVEFDKWNEERKGNTKNEKLVVPKLALGVKCNVYLGSNSDDAYVGHVQDIHEDEDLVTVYIEELCKKCTIPTNYVEVIPVPAYKALTWQGGKTYRIYGDQKSPSDKYKNKKKFWKRASSEPSEYPSVSGNAQPCSIGATSPHVNQFITRRNSGNMQASARSHSFHFSNSFRQPQQNKEIYKCNYDGQNIAPPRRFKKTPPRHAASTIPRSGSYSSPSYAQSWNGMERQTFAASPIPIPASVIPRNDQQHQHASAVMHSPSEHQFIQESDWNTPTNPENVNIQEYASTSPYVLTSMYAYETYQSFVPVSESGTVASDTQTASSSSSPLPIPTAHNSCSQHEMNPSAATSPVQAGSPTMMFVPYPMYQHMYFMYDGSSVPVNVVPWRTQDQIQGEALAGVPSVCFNTPPPANMSPPMTQWIPTATIPSSPRIHEMTPGTYTYASPGTVLSDINPYPQMLTPPWTPQPTSYMTSPSSGIIMSPPQTSYLMSPPMRYASPPVNNQPMQPNASESSCN